MPPQLTIGNLNNKGGMFMSNVFEIATNISTPLALAGLISTIFFYVLRLIIKKNIVTSLTRESTRKLLVLIINRIFILTVCAMIFGFSGYIIDRYFENGDGLKEVNVSGTVFLDNKELEHVEVKILEFEKSDVTNHYGKFSIDFVTVDSIKELTLTFAHNKAIEYQEVFTKPNLLKDIKIHLKPKLDEPIHEPTYIILSGKVVDTLGKPISNVQVSTMDGTIITSTNTNGYFLLESKILPHKNEILFSIFKQGYSSKDEYFYVNTTNLRIILD